MKKVLIALDYNPVSQKVVEEGHKLADLMGAEICLIHVVAEPVNYGTRYPAFMGYEGFEPGAYDLNLGAEMHKMAEDYLKSVAAHYQHEKISTYLAEGDAGKAILQYSKEWNADLIVMGTHSHSFLEKMLMGTVASKVLENTRIPVYMVPVKEEND